VRKWKLGVAAAFCVAATLSVPPVPAFADATRNSQWHLNVLGVAEAQKISRGEGVTVAVIDTGVDPSHPDLRNNVLKGKDIVANGSGDGRQDDDGHGTGMAGLIAAHGHGSADGALGIAPEAKVLPIRVENTGNHGNSDEVVRAIDYAVSQRTKVISISWGVGGTPGLRAAVDRARQADIVIVAAAGNRPEDVFVTYPAAIEGVVAVAATDRNGNHASVSVTGSQIVLAAPGVDIVSANKNGGYRNGSGTSDSAAIVAGAAALVRAKYPNLSADEVVHRLTATATDKGAPGRDDEYGYGVLNLVGALRDNVPPAGQASGSPTSGTTETDSAGSSTAAAAPTSASNDSGGGSTSTVLVVALLALLAAGGVGWAVIARRRRTTT
jgi:type VII secretion-associated serine protease mycosin